MNDLISRQAVRYKLAALVNEFEEILSHIREREVNDSVCGLCEYDGAYIGQSGDWCNECPGFEKDDCFRLSDECRKRWLESVELPAAQPEIIRCNDCKHWDGVDTCDVIDAPVWDKDFCSMAERRSDEE